MLLIIGPGIALGSRLAVACILSMKTPQPRQNLTRRASETCNSASSRLMAPYATMSTAIFTAAGGMRLALRVWRINNRPFSMVNSMS